MKIEIYSKDNCPFCINAKNAFAYHQQTYTEYKVGVDATKDDIQSRVNDLGLSTVVSTVPQIFIDDKYIGGYSDLVKQFDWARQYNSNKNRS